jgi:hypothetical protein
MIANLNHAKQKGPETRPVKCRAFRDLKNWHIEQYQQAVCENRWYMSQKLRRRVEWEEAEHDFSSKGYYGCAKQWRLEYCGNLCACREKCLLAERFKVESVPDAWSKAV